MAKRFILPAKLHGNKSFESNNWTIDAYIGYRAIIDPITFSGKISLEFIRNENCIHNLNSGSDIHKTNHYMTNLNNIIFLVIIFFLSLIIYLKIKKVEIIIKLNLYIYLI